MMALKLRHRKVFIMRMRTVARDNGKHYELISVMFNRFKV